MNNFTYFDNDLNTSNALFSLHDDEIYIYNETDFSIKNDNELYANIVSLLCVVILCAAVVINIIVAIAIWGTKYKGNGILAYIFQLCIVDAIGISGTGLVEMYAYYRGTWTLGLLSCKIYLGAETFSAAAVGYTIVALNLHTLVVTDLKCTEVRGRKFFTDESDFDSTSQNNLVVLHEEDRSSVSIIGKQKSDEKTVPHTLPAIMVWLLASSLSLTPLVLSNTTNFKELRTESCSISLITHHDDLTALLLFLLVSVFRACVPLLVLIGTCVALMYKLKKANKRNSTKLQRKQLLLAFVLNVSYILMTSHRSFLMVIQRFLPNFPIFEDEGSSYMSSILLNNDFILDTLRIPILSVMYYLISLLRPILCYWISMDVKIACGVVDTSQYIYI